MGMLTVAHASGVNGPWYWTWEWRTLPGGGLYLSMAVAGLPFALAQWLGARARRAQPAGGIAKRVRSMRAAIGLLMLACFGLQLGAIVNQVEPPGLARVTQIIEHPVVTSYHFDAVRDAARDAAGNGDEGIGIRDFQDRMWGFSLHGRNKPPGAWLFFSAVQRWFGSAALAEGLLLGLLGCLAIPATALLVSELTGDSDAGFAGASFLAMTPSLVLFFPAFDQVMPTLSCWLLVAWILALRRGSTPYAIAFGLALATALFFSFSFLVLGVFLAGYSLLYVSREPSTRIGPVAAKAGVALAVMLVFYSILYLAAGYDVLATFRTALENQTALSLKWGRPYPATILFDLQDFVLGAGWIGLPLAVFALGRTVRGAAPHLLWVVILCFAQPIVVAALGLIPTETARVWLFMLPLLMVPVGLSLARWSEAMRAGTYFSLWLILVVTCQHMSFVVLEGDVLAR